MKIYFASITFNKVPLVWDYNKKTNKAICLFITTEEKNPQDKAAVLHQLSEMNCPEVTITKDMASIEDMLNFTHTNLFKVYSPHLPIPELKLGLIENEHKTINVSKGFLTAITGGGSNREILNFHQSSSKEDISIDAKKNEIFKSTSKNSLFESPQRSFKSIALEQLIIREDDPGLWGDTVSYKSYFTKKTNDDRLARLDIYLRNKESFYKENQYILSDNICPLKSKIIILIEQLLEEVLNPAYLVWKMKQKTILSPKILNEFFSYFRGAVLSTMTNTYFNSEPTEYEKLTEEDREYKFRGNKIRFECANLEIRKSRACVMMMDWTALVDESCPLEAGAVQSMSTEAFIILDSFKKHLIVNQQLIDHSFSLIGKIQLLLIKSGEVERDNKLLTDTLGSKFANINTSIGEYTSFGSIIEKYLTLEKQKLTKKHAPSDELFREFNEQIVKKLIGMLLADIKLQNTPHVAKVTKVDNDIYLIKDWSLSVTAIFEQYHWDKIVKHLNDNKKCMTNADLIANKAFLIISAKASMLSRELTIKPQDQDVLVDDKSLSLK